MKAELINKSVSFSKIITYSELEASLLFKKCYNYSITKLFWVKHKRVLLVAFAALFLVALYISKNGLMGSGKEIFERGDGLVYESALVEDLVRKDTDGDGVLDWEESLWELDPTKAETTPGTPDLTVVNKLRAENPSLEGDSPAGPDYEENPTKTAQFAQELFATVTALEKGGALDQATAEKMVASLTEQISNSPQAKVYALADLKIIKDDSAVAVKIYNSTLDYVYTKYPIQGSIGDVLQKFLADENSVNVAALAELEPFVTQNKKIIDALVQMSVPQSFAILHLNVINTLEGVVENLSNIMLYESDPIMALSGISKYQEDALKLEANLNNLANAIISKLNN